MKRRVNGKSSVKASPIPTATKSPTGRSSRNETGRSTATAASQVRQQGATTSTERVKVEDVDMAKRLSTPVGTKNKITNGDCGITDEMIAEKAYELWQMRGGDAEFNWFEAQQILRELRSMGN